MMRVPLIKVLAVLAAIVVAPAAAYAFIDLNCPNKQKGFCTLKELLAGGSIRIDDKLFESFRNFVPLFIGKGPGTVGEAVKPERVKVFPVGEIPPGAFSDTPGLRFEGAEEIFAVGNKEVQDTKFTYTVKNVFGNDSITDNELIMPENKYQVTMDGSINISETFKIPGETKDREKKVNSGTKPFGTRSDRQDFPAQKELTVTTKILLKGGEDGFARLDAFEERFSQKIPEPSSMALFATTMGALLLTRRKNS